MRSPPLLPMRMNAAETNASNAIADCTLLTVVSRSWTTAEMDTFIIEVSTTSTNIAIESSTARRMFNGATVSVAPAWSVISAPPAFDIRNRTVAPSGAARPHPLRVTHDSARSTSAVLGCPGVAADCPCGIDLAAGWCRRRGGGLFRNREVLLGRLQLLRDLIFSHIRGLGDDAVRCLDVGRDLIGQVGLVDGDEAGLPGVERFA